MYLDLICMTDRGIFDVGLCSRKKKVSKKCVNGRIRKKLRVPMKNLNIQNMSSRCHILIYVILMRIYAYDRPT